MRHTPAVVLYNAVGYVAAKTVTVGFVNHRHHEAAFFQHALVRALAVGHSQSAVGVIPLEAYE